MAGSEPTQIDFELLCERFPKHCNRIKALARTNPTFSEICEDLCLACWNLKRFEAESPEKWQAEIPEYRKIIAELSAELAERLLSERIPASPPSG